MVNKIKEVKTHTISDLPEGKVQIRDDDFYKTEFLSNLCDFTSRISLLDRSGRHEKKWREY